MIRRGALFFLICIIGASSFGCAQLVSGLRRDLDEAESYDAPVIGGRWTEQGVLSEAPPNSDQYYGSGRGDRVPAGERGVRDMGSRSWVTPDSEEASVSSANTPVLEPLVRRQYKNGSRATRADFVDESPNEGSLWGGRHSVRQSRRRNRARCGA
jgi:hypothetical protein